MSNNGVEATKQPSPHRTGHQISRSISELSSPIQVHRSHHSEHHHRQLSLHRRRDDNRDDKLSIPQSTTPSVSGGRTSFEGFRSERASPNPSPNPSRRTSVFVPSEDNGVFARYGGPAARGPLTDEEARLEREQAADRVKYATYIYTTRQKDYGESSS